MTETKDELPLDTRLLSEAIIELNISRHNVSIYPKNHPVVEKSLNKVFDFLQKLFALRQDITLVVAKDVLIVDSHHLDKKNPVYKEFADSLSKKNIAFVTFISGLTKDELYSFHRFISDNAGNASPEDIQKLFIDCHITHLKIGSVDFSVFHLIEADGKQNEDHKISLWEKYVFGLLEGSLKPDESPDILSTIPPDQLAGYINRADSGKIREDSYEKVITSYVRKSSERSFSPNELKNVMDFINRLRPELKGHFLSSAVNVLSRDLETAEESLRDTSVDTVINLLSVINEQLVAIPEALKNILDKFSVFQQKSSEAPYYREGLIEDDFLLSPELTSLLSSADFKAFVTDSYHKDIQRLIQFNADSIQTEWIEEFKGEWQDEQIETFFHEIILELTLSETDGIIPREDCEFYAHILKDQIVQFIYTGQYEQALKTIRILESSSNSGKSPDGVSNILGYFHSGEFIALFIDSLKIMGREKREEILNMCEYYGEKMIASLIGALIGEESPSTRRFLTGLVTHFREKAVPDVVRYLNDDRWFVKRNMLFILNECGGQDALQYARSYCNHENPKVSYEALKCLLNFKDSFGIEALRDLLKSDSPDLLNRAIALSGTFKVREVVPELLEMLRRKSITGSNYEGKIHIVRALGQIGDSRALGTLKNILSEKSLLFRGALDRLKEEIRQSLRNYPDERG
ncbi:MAG: HEAT repeat domain-containing protein [Nitrospirae bacterium]|nr:HEAT repeat domain-containing protein [Nitrospirota bacterium]